MPRDVQAAINLLQRRRLPGSCGTAQIDSEILRRKYRLYSVTLLCPKTCLRLEVIAATQGRVAMDAMIDNGNHAALALKACLGRDVAADLKQFALRYFKLVASAQLRQDRACPCHDAGPPSSIRDPWRQSCAQTGALPRAEGIGRLGLFQESSVWLRSTDRSRRSSRFVCSCGEMRSTCSR